VPRTFLLPPFGTWWGDAALADLLPDDEQRARFVADCPRLPLSAYETPAPMVARWTEIAAGRSSYIRLSSAYHIQGRAAAEAGWPVQTLEIHLALLTDPVTVADPIVRA